MGGGGRIQDTRDGEEGREGMSSVSKVSYARWKGREEGKGCLQYPGFHMLGGRGGRKGRDIFSGFIC